MLFSFVMDNASPIKVLTFITENNLMQRVSYEVPTSFVICTVDMRDLRSNVHVLEFNIIPVS